MITGNGSTVDDTVPCAKSGLPRNRKKALTNKCLMVGKIIVDNTEKDNE
jgi:hypothetical protein